MGVPDVVGYTLGEAKVLLEREGVLVDAVSITSPPRCRHLDYNDDFRVIRLKVIDDKKVQLLVCNPKLSLK